MFLGSPTCHPKTVQGFGMRVALQVQGEQVGGAGFYRAMYIPHQLLAANRLLLSLLI